MDPSQVRCLLTDPTTCDGLTCPLVAPVRPFMDDVDALVEAVEAVNSVAKFAEGLVRHQEVVSARQAR